MQSTLYDEDLWRQYAAQLRALSGTIPDPRARRQTLEAADGFEHIAQLAGTLRSTGKRSLMRLLGRAI